MHKAFTTVFAFLLLNFSYSQSIKFEYDAGGNRVKRMPDGALPVTITRFNILKVESSALLEWQTVSESNFSHFDIERIRCKPYDGRSSQRRETDASHF